MTYMFRGEERNGDGNVPYKPKITRVKERDSTPPSKLGLTIKKTKG